MEVEIIETVAEFGALAEPWRVLGCATKARPFQDFAWVSAWLHSLSAVGSLRVTAPWDGPRLLAVLLLIVRRHNFVRALE